MSPSLLTPADLLGDWRLARVVDDRLGARIEVDGVASFVRRDATTIDWRERGTMRLPAGDVPVTSHRVLTLDAAGSWAVDFADGRGFHPWAVGTPLVHDCAPDVYRGRLDLAPFGWTMRWEASGPAKDYVIDSVYSRL